jgi:voltage-gated cation channel
VLQGPEPCFLIFLPALVMGNFMVLNLFLALLLNSFNSEELKNKKEVSRTLCGASGD